MRQEHWRLRIGLESTRIEILVTEELGRDAMETWEANLDTMKLKIEGYTDTADRAEVSFCVVSSEVVWMDLVRLY